MKKLVLSIIVLCFTAGSFAQDVVRIPNRRNLAAAKADTQIGDLSSQIKPMLPVRSFHKGTSPVNSTVTVTDIGNSPNHLTVAFGAKTSLFAHPEINSVMMVYRNDVSITGVNGSGSLNYSLSTDGGNNWPFTNANPFYVANGNNAPPFANARYPQGLIYNPTGNTIPDNAFLCYAAPSLVGANAAWGGMVTGALQISAGSTPNQFETINSSFFAPNTWMLAPATNKSYLVEIVYDLDSLQDYIDTLSLNVGNWNSTTNTFDYTTTSLYVPFAGGDTVVANEAYESRIAFSPGGLIGYIALLGHPDYATCYGDTVVVPMMYKTTDGGANWMYLGAIDLAGLSDTLPAAIDYSTWTECDLVVDLAGNAHLIVACGTSANNGTFSSLHKNWGIFDIYSTNGGMSAGDWKAQLLGNPQSFRYTWSSAGSPSTEYSRPQASTTWAHDKVFFTWFDTDTALYSNPLNINPDCWTKALDLSSGLWTPTMNMTKNTDADGACSFGTVAPYVFGNSGTYTIPVAYQALLDPTIGIATTTHKYISGVEITDAMFTETGTPIQLDLICIPTIGINESNASSTKSLFVYPNPTSGRYNTLAFTMEQTAKVTVELVNTIGQISKTVDFGVLNAGDQKLNLDVEGLQAGFYVVKVKAGNFNAVQKITVK